MFGLLFEGFRDQKYKTNAIRGLNFEGHNIFFFANANIDFAQMFKKIYNGRMILPLYSFFLLKCQTKTDEEKNNPPLFQNDEVIETHRN